LAAAIDQLVSPSDLPYTLRPPIKVPPNYKAKLKELEPIGNRINSKIEKQNQIDQEITRAKLVLKISLSGFY
jgi:hypothetical protein